VNDFSILESDSQAIYLIGAFDLSTEFAKRCFDALAG